MGSQDTIIQYLTVSNIILWIIVMILILLKIRSYIKNRQKIRAVVLDDERRIKKEYILSNRKEMIIGKSTVSCLVHIDFSDSRYSSTIEDRHAVLEKSGSYWYLRSEAVRGMVGLKRQGDGIVYKLKRGVPYQVEIGDVIYISYEKIYLKNGEKEKIWD